MSDFRKPDILGHTSKSSRVIAGLVIGLLMLFTLLGAFDKLESGTVESTFYLVIIAALYMTPAIVAHSRHHHNRAAITVLDIFLGWTFIGWVVALVWACTADTKREAN